MLADAGEDDRGRRMRGEQLRCKSSGKPSRTGAHARASLAMPSQLRFYPLDVRGHS